VPKLQRVGEANSLPPMIAPPPVFIGLTGLNASGKGTVADHLVRDGFAYHSLSDAIRHVLAERGLEPVREAMIVTGRELRAAGGPGALATHICGRLDLAKDAVIDSVRTPGEVLVLRGLPRFALIEIIAPEALRFDRIRARGRVGDPTDLATFRRLENAELTGDEAGQQLVATAALADHRLENSGDLGALITALEALVVRLRASAPR
jgi:dephospho-CoA kinase